MDKNTPLVSKKIKLGIKTILIIFIAWLLLYTYPCINSNGEKDCSLNKGYYIWVFSIIGYFALSLFVFKERKEILKYIVEFIILISGIYETIIIKNIIEGVYFIETFRITTLILVFILMMCLLGIREELEK